MTRATDTGKEFGMPNPAQIAERIREQIPQPDTALDLTDPNWKALYLGALQEHYGVVSVAARAVGVSTQIIATEIGRDPDFRHNCDQVRNQITDRLEHVMLDHAINGTIKGVWHEGERVGDEIIFDHRLAQWLLERRRRDQYRLNTAQYDSVEGVITFSFKCADQPTSIEAQAEEIEAPALEEKTPDD